MSRTLSSLNSDKYTRAVMISWRHIIPVCSFSVVMLAYLQIMPIDTHSYACHLNWQVACKLLSHWWYACHSVHHYQLSTTINHRKVYKHEKCSNQRRQQLDSGMPAVVGKPLYLPFGMPFTFPATPVAHCMPILPYSCLPVTGMPFDVYILCQ